MEYFNIDPKKITLHKQKVYAESVKKKETVNNSAWELLTKRKRLKFKVASKNSISNQKKDHCSSNGSTVTWNEEKHIFKSKAQRLVVKQMYRDSKKGNASSERDLMQSLMDKELTSQNKPRLRDIFKINGNKFHPAWKILIIKSPSNPGYYQFSVSRHRP
jgi:hypothetical protein